MPEAFWVIRVQDFPCVVTMDAHGKSLHADVKSSSQAKLAELIGD
jgi:fumarate hydratase class I